MNRMRKIFFGAFISFFLGSFAAHGGTYTNSSHGNSSTGVNRSTIDSKYSTYATGNCGHCHEQHASLGGVEPNPVNGAPADYATFAVEQNLCFECHDANGPASTDIWTEFHLTAPTASRHGGTLLETDGLHKADESTASAFIGANRHAECSDCHNPHQATNANPLQGATGVDVVNSTVWTEPGISGNTVVAVTDRLQQYKVCFKCHSGWGTPVTSGTSQAQEFNPNNLSYHNIEGAADPPSSNTYGNFNMTYVYKMMPRYNGYTNDQLRNVTMICSDCHGDTDTSPQGVHGSTIQNILKVPVGSPYNAWNNSLSIRSRGTVWCFNCHDPDFTNSGFSMGMNSLHVTKHNKSQAYCQTCHAAIPHGWKRSRFMIYTYDNGTGAIDQAPYNNALNQGLAPNIVWKSSGNWREQDCHGNNPQSIGNCD